MNFIKSYILLILLAASSVITACGTSVMAKGDNPFSSVTDKLPKDAYYAIVQIGEPLLLVADGVYDVDDSTKGAIGVFAYHLNKENRVEDLGEIRSQGTAYPLALVDGCLLVEGHHYSKKLALRDGEFKAVEEYYELFSDGGETVTYFKIDSEGSESEVDEKTYGEYMQRTSSLEVINFIKR